MGDKDKPEKIHISPKAAKKLREKAGKLPEGEAGNSILEAILKKLKGS